MISHVSLANIRRRRKRMGWSMPRVSAARTDFNRDFALPGTTARRSHSAFFCGKGNACCALISRARAASRRPVSPGASSIWRRLVPSHRGRFHLCREPCRTSPRWSWLFSYLHRGKLKGYSALAWRAVRTRLGSKVTSEKSVHRSSLRAAAGWGISTDIKQEDRHRGEAPW